MRHLSYLIVLSFLAACGGEAQQDASDLRSTDVAESPRPPGVSSEPSTQNGEASGPNIAITAAPGVAFNYRYAFRMPAQRIASVQEQHAQACEKLGVSRCRITGLRYRLVNERDIEGMLAFKLDPALARQFGKAGIEAVKNAEGMLVDSEISGVDAGAAIQSANRAVAQLNDDLARTEAQLNRRGLSADERTRLQYEAQRIRDAIRANRATRDEGEESLATTPVTFTYGSGNLVPGFDARSPAREAIDQAVRNFIGSLAAIFVIAITLLPWAVLAWLGWKLFGRWARRATRRDAEAAATQQQGESGTA
jgi:hypothetical protein